MKLLRGFLLLGLGTTLLAACSSTKKRTTSSELSALEGKKVALVSIDGEETPRKITEVALVNQLVQRGTFILIPKQDIEIARSAPDQNPLDWKGIAKRSGAEVALRAQILQFEANTREGYSKEEVYDSQLAEEQGTDGKTERVFKVKSLDGHVKIELKFTNLTTGETQEGIAEAQDHTEASAKNSSIHLPPSLRFLEKLSNKAFQDFFDRNR